MLDPGNTAVNKTGRAVINVSRSFTELEAIASFHRVRRAQ